MLADLGLTTQICNRFYTTLSRQQQALQPPPPPEVPSPAPRAQTEPLSYVRELRSRWELRLCAAVGKSSDKAGLPLMRGPARTRLAW